MRLLPGLLAGQEGRFELTGDESLRSRPMERIAEPLRRMGAQLETTDGRALHGRRRLPPADHLRAAGRERAGEVGRAARRALRRGRETTVEEPLPTRDHTENLLAQAGVRVTRKPHSVTVSPPGKLELGEVEIPGDFSAAAPFVVAGTLLAGSELTVHGVNLNPRRTGLLTVLERMGANITVFNRRRIGGEPAGDLDIRPRARRGDDQRRRGAAARRRAAALRPARRARAWRQRAPRRRRAAREGDRPDRGRRRRPPQPRRAHPRDAGGLHRPRRPRGSAAAARSTHAATTGSPCSARSPASSRGGVEVEGADSAAVSFPGFYDLLDSLRATTT